MSMSMEVYTIMYSLVQIWVEGSAFFKANAFQGCKDQTAHILIKKILFGPTCICFVSITVHHTSGNAL